MIGSIHVSWLAPKKVREITVAGNRRMATWDELAALRPVMIFNKGVAKKPRVGAQVVRVLAAINESIAKGGAPVAVGAAEDS